MNQVKKMEVCIIEVLSFKIWIVIYLMNID